MIQTRTMIETKMITWGCRCIFIWIKCQKICSFKFRAEQCTRDFVVTVLIQKKTVPMHTFKLRERSRISNAAWDYVPYFGVCTEKGPQAITNVETRNLRAGCISTVQLQPLLLILKWEKCQTKIYFRWKIANTRPSCYNMRIQSRYLLTQKQRGTYLET